MKFLIDQKRSPRLAALLRERGHDAVFRSVASSGFGVAWERLLDGPIEELLRTLTDPSPHGRELRQNSPFAGLLDVDEREQVLASWRASDHGDPR